ncbi:PIN domain-containing protein [Pseudorhodobacter aquimaris]|uniref:PIN domain-containing protein n=1 Tax=Pseudorhodobacter aquimaris TaxID=687412 RepID=UPI00067D9308|nr:PIN domain-containing protein [Pseudorhodobacter aquimaris]
MTVRIVLDTCVWLNLAGDYRNLPLLHRMESTVDECEVEFMVPDVVQAEFERNRDRVMKAAKTSRKDHFKRVRATIKQFGTGDTAAILEGILDVEQKMHMHGDAVDETLSKVEEIMAKATHLVPSVIARSRAATRGLDRVAPYHKTGIADAVILETYYEIVEESAHEDHRFAFITSNTDDFTHAKVDKSKPHPDIAYYFDGVRSVFATDIGDYFGNLMIDLDPTGAFDDFYIPDDPRVSSEINEAIAFLWDQVWYTRHVYNMEKIDSGEIQVTDEMPKDKPYDQTKITKGNLATLRAAGERVRHKYNDRPEVLGPFEDFEWGMINGKLSALRWVMGEEWDFLDT